MPYRRPAYRRRQFRIRAAFKKRSTFGRAYRKKSIRYLPRLRYSRIVPRAGTINRVFPNKLFTTLYYSDPAKTLTSAYGGAGVQTYRANSLYDPDVTGAGSQPRYFDTLCNNVGSVAPYYNYRVHAAKIVVSGIALESTSGGYLCICAAGNSTTDTVPGSVKECYERRRCRIFHLTPAGGSKDKCTLTLYAKNRELSNASKTEFIGNSAYSAAYNSNPTGVTYFHILWFSDNASEEASHLGYDVKISYMSEFFLLNDVADS